MVATMFVTWAAWLPKTAEEHAGGPSYVLIFSAGYAESQARAEAGGEDRVDLWLKPTATPDMMHVMLSHVKSQHGGPQQYLYQTGLSPQEVELLKSRLGA
jgi:hypothetical protein